MQEPTQYCCERKGDKDCGCRSRKAAHALALEIDRKITEGHFNLKDYFPRSKALKYFGILNIDEKVLISEYIDTWLDLKFVTNKHQKSL